MLKLFRNKRAQNTLEFALLVAAVVGGLLAIQMFMKRGVEGRLRSGTDSIGEQYDAQRTNSDFTVTRDASSREEQNFGSGTYRTDIWYDQTHKTGNERIEAPEH